MRERRNKNSDREGGARDSRSSPRLSREGSRVPPREVEREGRRLGGEGSTEGEELRTLGKSKVVRGGAFYCIFGGPTLSSWTRFVSLLSRSEYICGLKRSSRAEEEGD